MALPPVEESRLVGQTLGHYRVDEKIGAGGMGEVYRARDEHLDREVAIKVLPPLTLSDESSRRRFRKEALTLSKLNHPNIATIYDFDTQRGADFLVMEYIPGITLNESVAHGPLPEKEVLRLGVQLAEGLSAAHEHGVIHRDLKPHNLRVTVDGRLKILDFGLAKLRLPVTADARTESMSEVHAAAGTPPYMAPEQLLGGEADARTDIHAAGSILYELATGQRPFAETEGPQLIGAILQRVPQPMTSRNPAVSLELERIVGKCLEKERENRYQSAKELAVDLRRLGMSDGATFEAYAKRGRKVRTWQLVVSAVVLAALAVSGSLFFRTRRAQALTASDTVVLTDFVNKTGDAVFDDTMKQVLAVELGQSPFLKIISDRKVLTTLQMMGRPANQPITVEIGREVCVRTGSKAVLDGTISSLGSHYVVALNAVACSTGDILAKEEAEATSKEEVLKTLSRTSSRLRNKLGESLPSVQKFDVPFEAATSSLDALKNYTAAKKVLEREGDAPSIPLFKRAIEFDPNFALAYANLATAYHNLGQPSLGLDYATKAYQLRDHATELEKLEIEAVYFEATGELDKQIQTYKLWAANYPDDPVPHANLGSNYSFLGQQEKALAETQEAVRLEPNNALRYANLGVTYMFLDRLEEANHTLNQALDRKLDTADVRQIVYLVAFLRGDTQRMEQQVAWSAGRPGEEDILLSMQSDTEGYYGRLSKARQLSRRAVDSATRADSKETAAFWQANAALREAELGNAVLARKGIASALALSAGRDVKVMAALILARTGDLDRAEALALELEKNRPKNVILEVYWLPTIKSAIEISRGNSSRAVAYLEPAVPYEMGAPLPINNLYPAYVRGQAYLRAHNGPAAAAEFQKMLDHRGLAQNFVTAALAHLQVGRAYALTGDTARAKAAYGEFFNLWKDADPDIPVLKQAKVEYAKLR